MLGRDHSVGQETDFSAGEEKMDSEGAASVGTVGSAGSQEQGDPALRLYLNLIRDVPVLSREETAVLSEKIAQGEADFRNAMNRIPAVALRLISMWEDRRKDGRNTGLLAHGYHGDVRYDWASDIDRSFRGLVKSTRAQGLTCTDDLGSTKVEIDDRGVGFLEQCPILLEIYIDIHREFVECLEGATGKGARKQRATNGLSVPANRRYLEQATEALKEREAVRQEFSFHNLKLVVKVAKRFRGTGLPFLDLIQEGNCGLMRAVEKFDPSLGFAFSTYAVWWIEQSIIRSVQNQSRTIRTPSHIFQQRRDFEAVRQRLRAVRSEEPGAEEVGEALSMETDEVDRITAALRPVQSLDIPVSEDGMVTACDLLESEEVVDMGQSHDQLQISSRLYRGIGSLPDREREILEMRFGLRDGEQLTLRETGDRMGISRERVRQIQANALGRLRALSEIEGLASYVEACHDAA